MKNIAALFLLTIIACQPTDKELTAQQIIDKTIRYSGADKIKNSEINFAFREKQYSARRANGSFELSRSTRKDATILKETVTNNGYTRTLDGATLKVADSMVSRYSNAINSVHYFAVLPFGLNDKAVQKKLLNAATIKNKEYYKVEVTFSENGGGEDFEDVFIYWIGKEDFLIDYLAYSYHTNNGGKRFRVLKEQCIKNGIRFVDYHNYKPLNSTITLKNIDSAFEENLLKKVSEIVLKDIEVKLLD